MPNNGYCNCLVCIKILCMSNISEKRLKEIILYLVDNGEEKTIRHYNISPETLNRYKRKHRFNNTKQPRVLLLDVETTPELGLFWRPGRQWISHENILEPFNCLSWAAKWLFGAEMMSDILTPQESKIRNDKRIMKGMWQLLEDADIVVGHNCVEVNTPILTQKLKWVRAGDLSDGDKLIGFEEKKIPGEPTRKFNKWIGVNGKNRKIIPTEIKNFSVKRKPCMEVVFDNGDKIIVTKDHYWLGMAEKDRNQRWYKTEKLRVGQKIKRFFNVWNEDLSYEAGWLSGFISGEGSLKQSGRGFGVDFCQRPGSTWCQALNFCKKLNMPLSPYRKPKTGGLGKQDTLYTGFLGGKFKIVENIGRLQIKRFIEKIDWKTFGGLSGKDNCIGTITEINDAGIKKVAVFSTTSKTFFGAGYPMHNCDEFDIKIINTRFVINGFKPPMPFQTIDTFKIAKKHFRFSSNRLDFLGRLIRRKGKIKTDFDLWKRCLRGEQEALGYMLKYNKEDVLLLEEVYLFLRPWIKSHPNMSIYVDAQESVCPTCGSDKLNWCGSYVTMVSKFEAFRCNVCGAIGRCRTTSLSKEQKKELTASIAR